MSERNINSKRISKSKDDRCRIEHVHSVISLIQIYFKFLLIPDRAAAERAEADREK